MQSPERPGIGHERPGNGCSHQQQRARSEQARKPLLVPSVGGALRALLTKVNQRERDDHPEHMLHAKKPQHTVPKAHARIVKKRTAERTQPKIKPKPKDHLQVRKMNECLVQSLMRPAPGQPAPNPSAATNTDSQTEGKHHPAQSGVRVQNGNVERHRGFP